MATAIGKWRRLQQTAGGRGTFCILAIDHRGPLRRALASELPAGGDVDDTLTAIKLDITGHLGTLSSAVLLDPETGVGPCVSSAALDGQTGLIVALDTGSTGDPASRETGLVADWSVEKASRIGAAAVKLLMYYHPDAANAGEREQLVTTIAQECDRYEMPLFLEPLSCSPDDPKRPLPPDERPQVVVDTAKRLVPLGVDVLKVEFPVDVAQETDEDVWLDACQRLSAACDVPWVLLSGGVPFDTFLRQSRIACDAGASGVMVGRAVWKEAVTSDALARHEFLGSIGRERMRRLGALCEAFGRPFTKVHRPPEVVRAWYKDYGNRPRRK